VFYDTNAGPTATPATDDTTVTPATYLVIANAQITLPSGTPPTQSVTCTLLLNPVGTVLDTKTIDTGATSGGSNLAVELQGTATSDAVNKVFELSCTSPTGAVVSNMNIHAQQIVSATLSP
jgi:hypothetical protein